jgi:TPR repeat protein
VQAAAWYRKAAEQGHALAQFELALRYDMGHGLLRDYSEALAWYQKAAGQGHARAQLNVGLMYFSGQGVAADLGQAWLWLSMAERGGAHGAGKYLQAVASRMEPPQLALLRDRIELLPGAAPAADAADAAIVTPSATPAFLPH